MLWLQKLLWTSLENREKIGEIMFETFGIICLFFASESIISLYSLGKFTGLSFDSGDGITYFNPIFSGCSIISSVVRLNFAGIDLTEYMIKLWNDSGKNFSTVVEKEIIKEIKEKACYVALDYNEELKNIKEFKDFNKRNSNYELPDGTNVDIKEKE